MRPMSIQPQVFDINHLNPSRYVKGDWPAYNVKYIVGNIESVFRNGSIDKLSKGAYNFIILYMGFIAHYSLNGFKGTYHDLGLFAKRLQTGEHSNDYDYNLKWALKQRGPERIRDYGSAYIKSITVGISGIVTVARKYYPGRGTTGMPNPSQAEMAKQKLRVWTLANEVILPHMRLYKGDKFTIPQIVGHINRFGKTHKTNYGEVEKALKYLQSDWKVVKIHGNWVALREGEANPAGDASGRGLHAENWVGSAKDLIRKVSSSDARYSARDMQSGAIVYLDPTNLNDIEIYDSKTDQFYSSTGSDQRAVSILLNIRKGSKQADADDKGRYFNPGFPPAALKEFEKKGKKFNLSTTIRFTDMMIGTSPFGDGRQWALKFMTQSPTKGAAKVVAAKFSLSKQSVWNWFMDKRGGSNPRGPIAETPVIFRVWPPKQGGGVIAIFPTESGTMDPYTCSMYEHVGQHGAGDPVGVIRRTRAARTSEYAGLLKELHSIGYRKLRVYTRLQPSFLEARRRKIKVRPNPYFRMEEPQRAGVSYQEGTRVFKANFRDAESWIKRHFQQHPDHAHIDALRLRQNGEIGLSRRYFRDMTYRSF